MKRNLLVIGGIFLVCFLLVVRLMFKQRNGMDDERRWFAREVRYEFSAQVDSVMMYNNNGGKLWCRITAGDPQVQREDSLKRSFKRHDMLYLIFHRKADSIIFIVPNANLVAKGDSVRISSEHNTINFYRTGQLVATDELSNTLTGFGRPFFMKKK